MPTTNLRIKPQHASDVLNDCRELIADPNQIRDAVCRMAGTLNIRHQNDHLEVVCLLDGAAMFCNDLVRYLTIPVRIHYVKVTSYKGVRSTGSVAISNDELRRLQTKIWGQDVLVVDDILDTGLTLETIRHCLEPHAKTYGECVLLDKQKTPAAVPHHREVGLQIPDEFVVGYGLDYEGQYRHLPGLHVLNR